MIEPAEIDRIRAEVSCLEVLARHGVEMRRVGSEFVGLCPFHQEKTPSLYVNPTKNVFLCRGCGEGGDVIRLVCLLEGLDPRADFPEVLRRLGAPPSASTNWTRPRVKAPEGPPTPPPRMAGELLQRAVECCERLWTDQRLIERIATARRWRPEVLSSLCLDGALGWADHYELMGRTYRNCLTLSSLWGIKIRTKEQGERVIRQDGPLGPWPGCWLSTQTDVVLVEGETDAISARSSQIFGGAHVLASPGTGFPPWAAGLLAGKRVRICFDCDEAGKSAAQKTARLLSPVAASVEIISL